MDDLFFFAGAIDLQTTAPNNSQNLPPQFYRNFIYIKLELYLVEWSKATVTDPKVADANLRDDRIFLFNINNLFIFF